MNPKVSILIPVYKSSAYIEKCAESLFNQTFEDIEYIFVNDASPDDSIDKLLKIIDRYPEHKNQIKFIQHKQNKGPAVSRNEALQISRGKYISLVDSDDYIDPEMIEILFKKAEYTEADIVVSDILMDYRKKSVYKVDFLSDNKESQFENMVINKLSQGYLWNKLIKRSMFTNKDCLFTNELDYLEDKLLSIKLYYFATKIVKVNQAFYHYNQVNDNSITRSKSLIHFQNVLLFWELLEDFFHKQYEYENFKSIIERSKIEDKVRLLIDTHSSQLRKEFATMFYEEETHYLKYFKRGERLMLLLVRYRLFCFAQLFHNYLITKNLIKRKLSLL